MYVRRVCLKILKGGNQNPLIEGQTTQWSKEKGQKDKQRSTKLTVHNSNFESCKRKTKPLSKTDPPKYKG